ncbi:MAG: U32 family peptidase [Bauldia sp.]|nr:U32 family peptidase [Bauldia sp.]
MTELHFPAPELVCPAGTPAALRSAVAAGANAVYCGLRNATNARNFPGLNFTPDELGEAVEFSHRRGVRVFLAVNTFPAAGRFDQWREAIDIAHRAGVDAVVVADIGVTDYAAETYPALRRHLSVQAGASSVEAIGYYCDAYAISRVILPRLLTTAEIGGICTAVACEVEVFVFGNIGMMAEGRCSLNSYATGTSTNMDGICSAACDVRFEQEADGTTAARVGPFLVDRLASGERAGYPTICKGSYSGAGGRTPYYAFEEPRTLNLIGLLGELIAAGARAFKIEGRQRSQAYVQEVVSAFRSVLDSVGSTDLPHPVLDHVAEAGRETHGAFGGKRWR